MNKLGITFKLTLIFVLFAGALLAGVSLPAYNSGRTSLETAAYSELLATAIEKQAALNTWVADRQQSIGGIANQAPLGQMVAALLAAAPGSQEAALAHANVLTYLRNWAGLGQWFTSMEVINASSAQVIAATDINDEGKFRDDQSYFIDGLQSAYVENPYYDISTQHPGMTAAAPVKSPMGRCSPSWQVPSTWMK